MSNTNTHTAIVVILNSIELLHSLAEDCMVGHGNISIVPFALYCPLNELIDLFYKGFINRL